MVGSELIFKNNDQNSISDTIIAKYLISICPFPEHYRNELPYKNILIEFYWPFFYIFVLSLLLKLDYCLCICVYIYIYICNELIEETAGRRKLIFGMWEYFGYGSSKF